MADNWIPATKPKMVSLNTNMRIAAEAPNPAKSVLGDLLISTETMMIPPTKNRMTWKICIKLFMALLRINNSTELTANKIQPII